MFDEQTSPWKKYKQSIGDTRPWDLLNPNKQKLDQKSASERLDTCLGCEHLIQLTSQCKKCGCFMPGKVKLTEAKCPIGNW